MRSLPRSIAEPRLVLCLALAVIAALQQLAAQPAPVRVEVGDADKAFVVEPGSTVTLRARVATEPGASFGGAVLFVVPDNPSTGAFPASTESSDRVIVVPVAAGGVAEATLVTNDVEGFFLASAWAVGSDAITTFAVTNRRGAPQPALGSEQALARLRSDAVGAAVEERDVRIHGPFLIPAGAQYGPVVSTDVLDGAGPQAATEESWFYWIDDLPGAEFSHDVRYGLIPASGAAPETPDLFGQSWWPQLILPNATVVSPLPGALNDIRIADFVDSAAPSIDSATAAIRAGMVAAPNGNCVIAVYGPDLMGGASDVERFRDYLLANDLVNGDRVFMTTGNKAATKADLARLAKQAKDSGCTKLFLLIRSHGSEGARAGVSLAPGPTEKAKGRKSEPLTYEELAADTLGPLKGMDIWGILNACYSGQFPGYLEGRGYTGTIFTSASRDTPSWMSPRGGVFVEFFLDALEQRGATANWNDAFVDATNAARDDVDEIFSGNGDKFLGAGPGFAPLDPNGIRALHGRDILVPHMGRKLVGIRLPVDFDKQASYTATLKIENPALAELAGPVKVSATGTLTFPVQGRACGESRYQVLIQNEATGQRWSAFGRIQVGDYRLSQEVVTIELDGQSQGSATVTLTRFGRNADTPARMVVRSVDPSVARWKFELPRPVLGRTAAIDVVAVGPGETELEVLLESGSPKKVSKKKIKVIVVGADGGTSTGCMLDSGMSVDDAQVALVSNSGNMLEKTTEALGEGPPEEVNITIKDGILSGDHPWFQALNFYGRSEGCRGEVSDVLRTQQGSSQLRKEQLSGPNISVDGVFEFSGENLENFSYSPRFRELGSSPVGGRGDLTLMITGTRSAGPPAVRFSSDPTPLIPKSGGEVEVAVVAVGDAAWTATSDSAHLQFHQISDPDEGGAAQRVTQSAGVSQVQGSGARNLIVLVAENTGPEPREGTVTVGGDELAIRQEGSNSRTPVISPGGVVGGATFSPGVVSGGWTSILGEFFLDSVQLWGDNDFRAPGALSVEGGGRNQPAPGSLLPTQLAGVSATVDGQPAFVSFTSPNQLNVLIDDSNVFGDVDVQVTTPDGTSISSSVYKDIYLPEFFRFQPQGSRFVAGVHPDGTFLGPEGLFNGLTTRPAKPGDVVLLFGAGWGATIPPSPSSVLVTSPAALETPAVMQIGGVNARVLFGGIVGSGLYQFNVEIPEVAAGEQRIEGFVGGVAIAQDAYIAIGQ